MLIIDNILWLPISGILSIVREVHNAAQQELDAETETITSELRDLYMLLETGKITSAAFDAREKELLDRLEEIEDLG